MIDAGALGAATITMRDGHNRGQKADEGAPSAIRRLSSVLCPLPSVPCPLKPGNCFAGSAVVTSNMYFPTHEEISARGYALWEQRGRPANAESEIWLAAEAQLRAEALNVESRTSKDESHARLAEGLDESRHSSKSGGGQIAPTSVEHQAIIDELQKQSARAPQVPHHTGPKANPAPPGKPIWSKPHGS